MEHTKCLLRTNIFRAIASRARGHHIDVTARVRSSVLGQAQAPAPYNRRHATSTPQARNTFLSPVRVTYARFCSSAVEATTTTTTEPAILPNHRLLARTFHRVPASTRNLSAGSRRGLGSNQHPTEEKDTHNVLTDAVKDAKNERSEGTASRGTGNPATSEKSGKGR
ncbi:hypothetical protein B0O99DRAFT_683365 [Bisporella sp. PMI_857]|nr:hypothetical protein B0O99DRAFT_683365 [Bisporella sp. PMI_857]